MSKPETGPRSLGWQSRLLSRAPSSRCNRRPNDVMRRALAIGVLAFAVTTGLASAADNQPAAGRRIFRFGGDAGEVRATFAASNAMLPPGVRRCAGCHGADGAGTREGGVPTPPISWAALA